MLLPAARGSFDLRLDCTSVCLKSYTGSKNRRAKSLTPTRTALCNGEGNRAGPRTQQEDLSKGRCDIWHENGPTATIILEALCSDAQISHAFNGQVCHWVCHQHVNHFCKMQARRSTFEINAHCETSSNFKPLHYGTSTRCDLRVLHSKPRFVVHFHSASRFRLGSTSRSRYAAAM